jgi:type IV secretion system protein VirB9
VKSIVVGLMLTAILAFPAAAEQKPVSGGYDRHVQLVPYNALNVVRVVSSPTNSTEVIFSAGERIVQIAVGDSDGWLSQPEGNLLFIKPLLLNPPTNMQVVTTNAAGTTRSYQFHLVSQKAEDNGESAAIYAVTFSYPDDELAMARIKSQIAQVQVAVAATREAQSDAEKKLADAWKDGPRNWRYVAQGSKQIEPAEVSDNGRQTAFRFPGNIRVPTIYAIAPDGSEYIVPYTMIGDEAVVQVAAASFILRDGQEALRILNQGFDPVGQNPRHETGTPDLKRVVKGGVNE